MEKTEKNRAETHLRIHNKTGFVLSMDIDKPVEEVINHLVMFKRGGV
jgi:hypothetical protein